MLANFRVKNYKSFRDMAEFSMIAGRFHRHPSHVAEVRGKQLLRSAFMFGANAGGKSNFVKAIAFVSAIVKGGLDNVDCDRCYFRVLPKGQCCDIGVFQFTIFTEGQYYEYGLAISYSKASIVAEWLSLVGDKEQIVFSFDWQNGERVQPEGFALSDDEKTRYGVYEGDAWALKIHKRTFLSEVATKGKASTSSSLFAHFIAVYNWFRMLIVIFPETRYGGRTRYLTDTQENERFSKLLVNFDTGIQGLRSEEVDVDKLFSGIPEEVGKQFKADLIAELTGEDGRSGHNDISVKIDEDSCLVQFVDGKLQAQRTVFTHGEDEQLFRLSEESDGTQRLFDLLPLMNVFPKDRVVIVDELDRSLHTKATHKFIREFFDCCKGRNSQLIATTHDASVLNLDVLRQDEIWFVERDKECASRLYPLTKFNPRFDKDISKDYLLGRYGALPIFRAARCY